MAKKKIVLTSEVSTLLNQLLTALPEEENRANASASAPKKVKRPSAAKALQGAPMAESAEPSNGQAWPNDKKNIQLVRDALQRNLNGNYAEGNSLGRIGAPFQFTKPNPVNPPQGPSYIYPSLDELTDYYVKRYPNQINGHFVGRKALLSLLNVPNVTAVKIKYGLLPDYEKTVKSVGQRLILTAIYRLQQLLKEQEPRQIILVGVDDKGKEIRTISRQLEGANSSGPNLGGVHGTEHSMQAGQTESFQSGVPSILMGRQEPGEAIDMVPNSPPN